MTWLIILALAVASGALGRMGGVGKPYDSKYRDICCSIIVVFAVLILFGWHPSFWWAYVLIFGLHWVAFSTYLDVAFGYDNFMASGALVGLALAPILFINPDLWWVVLARVVGLAVIWWALNKYLPAKVLIWRKDVAEEFLRYLVSL